MGKEVSIIEIFERFPSNEVCLDHLAQIRWGDEPACPYCSSKRITKFKNEHRFHCNSCNTSFSVTVGTIFHKTKISLQKWFVAITLLLNARKGISARQLARDINVNKNTAWYLAMRIRKAFTVNKELLTGIIELDETFVGGKNKNRHWDKKVHNSQGRSFKDKIPVFGLLQRATDSEGKKVYAYAIPNTQKKTLQKEVKHYIEKGSTVLTDEWKAYSGLHWQYNHHICDHSKKQYVAEDGSTTNSLEGFWSIVKRGIIGQYHKISKKYINKYMNEFCFRYNTMDEEDVFGTVLNNALQNTG